MKIITGYQQFKDMRAELSEVSFIPTMGNLHADELVRIINNLIDEEILYREALLLGLDQEDTIIKRRLAQKITFLKEESIPEIPSAKELKEY